MYLLIKKRKEKRNIHQRHSQNNFYDNFLSQLFGKINNSAVLKKRKQNFSKNNSFMFVT